MKNKKISVRVIETFEYELTLDNFDRDYIKDCSIASEIKFVDDCPWIDDSDAPKRKHLKKTIKIIK